MARKERSGRALHLFRFLTNSLIYMISREGRGGRSKGTQALHLFRPGVTSLPDRRRNPASEALHLSAEVPFSAIKTTTFRPLLFFPVFPVIDPLAAKLPSESETELSTSNRP